MNDLVIAALLNLFALFSSVSHIKRDKARELVYNYLVCFYGIHNVDEYLSLFDNLCDVYSMEDLDTETILTTVCSKLQRKIPVQEQALLVLRFMEFSAINPESYKENFKLFEFAAGKLGVSDSMFKDFADYIDGIPGEHVAVADCQGIEGSIKILRVSEFNKTLLTYTGPEQLYLSEMPIRSGVYVIWEKNGIIKSHKIAPIYFAFADALLGKVNKDKEVTLCGRNVDYRFSNNPKMGLHNFTFDIHSGELVAVMGGSGVGKSTLLGILNGTQPPASGEILVNGHSLYGEPDKVKHLIGFVPQDDLLIEELTVRDNLLYTARFCFDGMSEAELSAKVEKILSDLDLLYIANLKVGSPLNKTISGGQRKRLNIALELIREPAILFLDEPTSGLSSADSEKVVHLLKEQTFLGRLIIVNIHQPSSDIYKMFDRLWLLDKGGYPIYDGNPIEAVSTFKKAANYADAEVSLCKACGNINPETILDIVDAKALNNNGEITTERKISPEEWNRMYLDRAETFQTPKVFAVPKTEQKKPNAFKQFCIYLSRAIKTKLTDRQFLLVALLEAPVLAVISAVLTHYKGDGGYTLLENKNLLSYFFMAIIVAIFMGMSITAEEIFKDRALLKREKFLCLSYGSYISSKIVLTAMIAAVQTLLFILVGNSLAGIHDLFWVWWLILFTSAFVAGLTGLFLSQALGSIVTIYITIPLLLIPQILLCGLVVPFGDLNQHSKTNNVPIIGDLIPSRWSYEALAVTSYTDNRYNSKFFDYERGQYVLQMENAGVLHQVKVSLNQAYQSKRLHENDFDKDFSMIKREIERMTHKWELDSCYSLDKLNAAEFDTVVYSAVADWIEKSGRTLNRMSRQWTKALDAEKQLYLEQYGSEILVKEQSKYCNTKLQETVLNVGQDNMVKVEQGVIVPQVGAIYLEPVSRNGRAPFYSHVKLIGNLQISTLWFNMGILWLMAIIVAVLLYTDTPAQYMREKK